MHLNIQKQLIFGLLVVYWHNYWVEVLYFQDRII